MLFQSPNQLGQSSEGMELTNAVKLESTLIAGVSLFSRLAHFIRCVLWHVEKPARASVWCRPRRVPGKRPQSYCKCKVDGQSWRRARGNGWVVDCLPLVVWHCCFGIGKDISNSDDIPLSMTARVSHYQNATILDFIRARMIEVVMITRAIRRAKLQSNVSTSCTNSHLDYTYWGRGS